MARIIKPPKAIPKHSKFPMIFLAGSIDMGRAEPWQTLVEAVLTDEPVLLLNPRRDDWHPSWKQSIHNPSFRGQVEWELEGLERADLILVYFAATTQAPVSLLEMGLFAQSKKMLVCCPPGYWRKGHVEIVCKRYQVPIYRDLESLLLAVRGRIKELQEKK